jgi:hypothetical protein
MHVLEPMRERSDPTSTISGVESPAFRSGEETPCALAHNSFTDITPDILCEILYTCSMKQMITAKLKLHTAASQFQALRTTQLAYRDALPLCLSLLVCVWQEE